MADPTLPPLAGACRPGQVIADRYALTQLLARGGMADVWQATDNLLERQVAVKILHPHLAADADFVRRFRTEAVAAARLHHPGIVSIFDTCGSDGVEAIVMELVRGHTLREELDQHGPMEPTLVVDLGAEVAAALEVAHTAGLVHRDVKPANILLCDDDRVLVTDFGIAKIRDTTDKTQTGTMLGSVKYLAPEQVEGKPVDPRTDVYALGIVLYEALTGQVPFQADTPAAVALARLHTTPAHPRELAPGTPRLLDEVVMKALAREPERRFASAGEFRTALLATRTGRVHPGPGPAAPPGPPPVATAPAPALATTAATRPPAPADPDATVIEPRPVAPSAHPDATAAYAAPTVAASRSRRRWGAVVVALVLVVAALAVVGVLLVRNQDAPSAGPTTPAPTVAPTGPLRITAVQPFDPQGDGVEGNNTVAGATDGNPATGWKTEQYENRQFANPNKKGVGLVLFLDRTAALDTLTVQSPTSDWAAEVYVGDGNATDLSGWGEPVATGTQLGATTDFDLGGAEGAAVLLWITDLGSGPPRVFTEISEVTVTER